MTTNTEIASLLQAMGHPLRLAILRGLAFGPRTVGQLQAQTGEAQALVSTHLGKLRAAGLVRADRGELDARAIFYSVADARVGRVLAAMDRDEDSAGTSGTPPCKG